MKGGVVMDVLNILVSGDLLATFVNMFTVVVILDFISNFVQVLKMR